VEPDHAEISVRRQCELLGVNRSRLYYQPVGESGFLPDALERALR
jgi:putative transposase